MNKDLVLWLEEWYASHCDGEWEQNNSMIITTTSNPGWMVEISLAGTELEAFELTLPIYEADDHDWFGFKIADKKFKGAGDPDKLEFILRRFQMFALFKNPEVFKEIPDGYNEFKE